MELTCSLSDDVPRPSHARTRPRGRGGSCALEGRADAVDEHVDEVTDRGQIQIQL